VPASLWYWRLPGWALATVATALAAFVVAGRIAVPIDRGGRVDSRLDRGFS
jgi:hypothetical protein